MKKLELSLFLLLSFFQLNSQGLVWYENTPTKVLTADFDLNNIVDITPESIGTIYGIALNIAKGHIYLCYLGFSNVSPGILRMNMDGSNVEHFLTGLDAPTSIAIDQENDKVYWIEHYGIVIKRANLDGSNIETVLNVGGYAVEDVHLAIDNNNNRIYFNKPGNRALFYFNLSGGSAEKLYEPGTFSRCYDLELVTSESRLYYLHTEDFGLYRSTIGRVNLDGTNPEQLMEFEYDFTATSVGDLKNITIDTVLGDIYFVYNGEKKIGKVDLGGTMSEKIYQTQGGSIGQVRIAYDFTTATNENVLEKQISVFPNPFKDAIQIVTDQVNIRGYSLFNASGALLNQRNVGSQKNLTVEVKPLPRGVYFLKLYLDNNNIQIKKIVKR